MQQYAPPGYPQNVSRPNWVPHPLNSKRVFPLLGPKGETDSPAGRVWGDPIRTTGQKLWCPVYYIYCILYYKTPQKYFYKIFGCSQTVLLKTFAFKLCQRSVDGQARRFLSVTTSVRKNLQFIIFNARQKDFLLRLERMEFYFIWKEKCS
jgi:hypothetical protein